MAGAGKKRRQHKGLGEPSGAEQKKVRTHDWVKDSEEIDLEARLFGGSTARGGVKGESNAADEEEDTGLGGVDDDDVRQPAGIRGIVLIAAFHGRCASYGPSFGRRERG